MSRRFKLFPSLVLTILLSGGFISPASAAGPQISVTSINKTSVAPGDSLRVEYRITDDGQCCNSHDVYMYDPTGAWVTRVQGSKISGTDQDSQWGANITVPVNSVGQNAGTALVAGTYTFKTQTTDAQNNYSELVLLGSVTVAIPAPTPINLSSQIQAQNITATIENNFATLIVNVPDARGWTWSVIWDGAAQRTNITSFPYQTASGWTVNKSIQLYAVDSQNNYGYSATFTPTVVTATPSPSPTPSATPTPTATPTASSSPSPSPTASTTSSPSPSPIPSAAPTTLPTLPQTQGTSAIAPSTFGGIVRTNTIFTRSNSPYQLTSTVQIAEGAVLEVEPGVVIDGSKTDLMFLVQGHLAMRGTADNRIRLIGKPNAYVSNKGSKATAKVELNGVFIDGGGAIMPPTGSAGYATFTMRFCEVVNVAKYTYIWYPGGTSVVEFNAFRNSGGFSVGFDARDGSDSGFKRVVFRNNLFSGPSTTGYWIENWASYGGALEVENNSFIDGPYTALKVKYDSSKIEASRNFWGTTDINAIQAMVLDQNDSLEYKSIINVSAPLSDPNVSTPSRFTSSSNTSVVTPSPTPNATSQPSSTPTASATEEPELESEEEYEPYIEATVVSGKTRFLVGGEPKTKYRVEATLRGIKRSFNVTTNIDGEIAFRTAKNLKGYNVVLIFNGKIVAKTKVS